MSITIRVRSLVWFVTGAVIATAVTLMFVNAWRADALPGDMDSTLVPITPCRLLDTRDEGASPFGPDETRTIETHGTNRECTIPPDAVALSMNVTALNATASGNYLTIWPADADRPEASSLNPAPGEPPTPNAVVSPISPAGQLAVYNRAGEVDLLIDVNGYYTSDELRRTFANFEIQSATSRTVTTAWTEVLEVYGTNSGTGQLVLATFEISEPNDNVEVECGFAPTANATSPDSDRRWTWESPDQGDLTPVTITAHFSRGESGSAVALWCRNESGTSALRNIQLTVIGNNVD